MKATPNILERSVLPAGKVFIKAGDENARAYVIQAGDVASFTMQNGRRVEVARHGPGTIIGEICLMIDEPATLSYEAMETTTVITVTRQDFQKRLVRADKSVKTILEHAVNKISKYENEDMFTAIKNANIDETALPLVNSLLAGIDPLHRKIYEDAMLPHINGLIKAIKDVKKKTSAAKKSA